MLADANDVIEAVDSARRKPTVAAPVRVAVVGCGAMTRQNLMPVLAGYDRIRLEALVDINEPHARALADAYRVGRVLTSLDDLTRELVDAVIIATPPALHMPQAVELAARGLHLFVEKPMALSVAEGERMIGAAARAGVTLSVGFYRRLLPATRLLRGLLESGVVGSPVAVDIEEGGAYGWPLATLGNLTRHFGGGGVLIDIGSHVLDQLLFLLPGSARVMSYADNARGGVETDAVLELALSTRGREIPCRVELSRTRSLRGSIRVECERGTLELPRGEFSHVRVIHAGVAVRDPLAATRPVQVSARWSDEEPPIGYQVFRTELDDWVTAMTSGSEPALSGRSALAVVQVIEDAYNSVVTLAEPWTDEGLTPSATRRARLGAGRRRVLITGASGFIGCRAAELLALRDGCEVRALVRNPSNAARLARLPVEMVAGDICSPADVAGALAGCDAVVHCAVGTSWQRAEASRVTVDGTRTVAEAATRAGVARFIHVSSMAVHQAVSASPLSEMTPLVPPTDSGYGGDKRKAEDEVLRLVQSGLPAVILRPARVYGAFGKTFVTRPVEHLARGRLVLSGPVDGPAGMVYVDNVVEAIVRGLEGDSSIVGEAFLISDPDQVSWREFYGFFADALGASLRVAADEEPNEVVATPGVFARWRRGMAEIVCSPEFRGLARKCLDTDPIGTLPRKLWNEAPAFRRRVQDALGMTEAVVYRPAAAPQGSDLQFRVESAVIAVEKAARRLACQPVVSRERAMALTLEWVQQSRIF